MGLNKTLLAQIIGIMGNSAPAVRRYVGRRLQFPETSRSVAAATANSWNGRIKQISTVDVVNPSICLPGFSFDSSFEAAIPSAQVWQCAIEVTGGPTHEFTLSGSASITVTGADIIVESDPIAGLTIPAGTEYYLRWHGTIASGSFVESGLYNNGGNVIQYERGIDLTDKHMTGTVGLTGGYLCMPCGLKSDVSASYRCFAAIGDSIVGSTDTDPMTRHLLGRFDYCKLARSGAAATLAVAGTNYAKRRAAIQALGFTDAWVDYGINDIGGGAKTAAQTITVLGTFYGFLTAAGVSRIYQSTVTPYSKPLDAQPAFSSSNRVSDSNQQVYSSNVATHRPTLNSTIRAHGITGMTNHVEWATTAENALNSDWWKATYSDDGLHPNATYGQQPIADATIAANPFAL